MRRINLFSLFIFLILASVSAYSQQIPLISSELEKFKKNKDFKVQLGMTAQEVRSLLGSPKAIDGGFPKSEEQLIHEFPDMVGQLNNSTWVYMYNPILVTFIPISKYYVNGQEVDESDYNLYKSMVYVYLLDGKVIGPGMGEGYKNTKNPLLRTVMKDNSTTKIEIGSAYKANVIPIYCVIFEKGTQSVALTKAYFMK